MPPKHLELLQSLFPDVLMLDIDQIASLMRYGRGHLYNLHHQGKLPFKVHRGIGNKILVSIVEMAAYLDKTMLSEYDPQAHQLGELVVKKRGRPRGASTKTSAMVSGFQSDLRSAIYRVQAKDLLLGIGQSILNADMGADESPTCESRLRQALSQLSGGVKDALSEYDRLHAKLSQVASPDIPHEDRLIPFFTSPDGLVVGLVVDELGGRYEFPAEQCQVRWMTWSLGLSLVWLDEAKRQLWLAKMADVISGLASTVADHRRRALLRI